MVIRLTLEGRAPLCCCLSLGSWSGPSPGRCSIAGFEPTTGPSPSSAARIYLADIHRRARRLVGPAPGERHRGRRLWGQPSALGLGALAYELLHTTRTTALSEAGHSRSGCKPLGRGHPESRFGLRTGRFVGRAGERHDWTGTPEPALSGSAVRSRQQSSAGPSGKLMIPSVPSMTNLGYGWWRRRNAAAT